MKYYLMHKNIEVAILDIDNQSNLNKILGVMRYDHMPYGSLQKNNIVDRHGLQRWWWSRSIPVSRHGLDILLETLSIPTPSVLIEKCLGLSLTDQYWIKPTDAAITWENVNFFTNPFSDDIGNILFGETLDKNSIMFNSPDITSGGNLIKKWKIINGERCLIKGGSKPDLQEPLNELIAAKVADLLDIPHVEYSLIWNDGNPYSVCPDFIDGNTELVTANSIRLTQSKPNSMSDYDFFRKCCVALGIPDPKPILDKMIVFDYIIANTDRHYNNFGFIRNADTLEWIGPAPIFDNGNSLGFNDRPCDILKIGKLPSKPFKPSFQEQLKLVSDYSWIDAYALSFIDKIVAEILSDKRAGISSEKQTAIIGALRQRVENVKTHLPIQYTSLDSER